VSEARKPPFSDSEESPFSRHATIQGPSSRHATIQGLRHTGTPGTGVLRAVSAHRAYLIKNKSTKPLNASKSAPTHPRFEKAFFWGGMAPPPLRKTPKPAPPKNATSQSRCKAHGNRSFNALRLGGMVKVPLCCDEANSTRSIHVLLGTRANFVIFQVRCFPRV